MKNEGDEVKEEEARLKETAIDDFSNLPGARKGTNSEILLFRNDISYRSDSRSNYYLILGLLLSFVVPFILLGLFDLSRALGVKNIPLHGLPKLFLRSALSAGQIGVISAFGVYVILLVRHSLWKKTCISILEVVAYVVSISFSSLLIGTFMSKEIFLFSWPDSVSAIKLNWMTLVNYSYSPFLLNFCPAFLGSLSFLLLVTNNFRKRFDSTAFDPCLIDLERTSNIRGAIDSKSEERLNQDRKHIDSVQLDNIDYDDKKS